jgi:rhamnogalacturonyl hydrolase YesR
MILIIHNVARLDASCYDVALLDHESSPGQSSISNDMVGCISSSLEDGLVDQEGTQTAASSASTLLEDGHPSGSGGHSDHSLICLHPACSGKQSITSITVVTRKSTVAIVLE